MSILRDTWRTSDLCFDLGLTFNGERLEIASAEADNDETSLKLFNPVKP